MQRELGRLNNEAQPPGRHRLNSSFRNSFPFSINFDGVVAPATCYFPAVA